MMMKNKQTILPVSRLFFIAIGYFSISALYITKCILGEIHATVPYRGSSPSPQRQLSSSKDLRSKRGVHRKDAEQSKNHSFDTYYAFIRIPKTGSTSLSTFLKYNTGFKSIDNFIRDVPTFLDERMKENTGNMHACVFGSMETTQKLVLSENNHKSTSPVPLEKLNCSHRSYKSINRYFRDKVIPALKDPFRPTTDPASSLLSFTIVREPYDRWKSYFYYAYKGRHKELWKDDASHAQWECILKGDFPRWLKLVGREKRRPWKQYEFLGTHDVDKAISFIRRDTSGTPKVHVYVNECFEVSLYMMSEVLSIPSTAITDFVESDQFVKNPNSSSSKKKNDNDNDEEQTLRENAKVWFADEYKFYNAAVQEFQRTMAVTGIIRSLKDQSLKYPLQTSCMYA